MSNEVRSGQKRKVETPFCNRCEDSINAAIKHPERFDDNYRARILSLMELCPPCRRINAEGRVEILAERNQSLSFENERLRKALERMLHIFDRDLPADSIGKTACDKAREALNENTRKMETE